MVGRGIVGTRVTKARRTTQIEKEVTIAIESDTVICANEAEPTSSTITTVYIVGHIAHLKPEIVQPSGWIGNGVVRERQLCRSIQITGTFQIANHALRHDVNEPRVTDIVRYHTTRIGFKTSRPIRTGHASVEIDIDIENGIGIAYLRNLSYDLRSSIRL